ncbi:MAG: hypothetical protein JNK05_32035 [Myxococcales bacterium]|nr:hypothetical protein [Myxococcales bacterium]
MTIHFVYRALFRHGPASIVAVATVASLSVGACDSYDVCDPIAAVPAHAAANATLPTLLSATGLYADTARQTLAPSVRPFQPRFQLWSDGAEKRRWFALPPNATIDTRDMNDWVFPVGSRFWKEFTRDGVRVETRLIQRTGSGPSDWAFMAYVWNDAGTEAIATPGGMADARGTNHDVPAADRCVGCHGGRMSRVLGFSAIQLSSDDAAQSALLNDLIADGLLTVAPTRNFELPGNETERAALGYLHANCGHCHNTARPPRQGARCFDPQRELDFWLRVDALGSPATTPTYATAVGRAVEPGHPERSAVVRLMSRRGGRLQMPPLATERVDASGVALVTAWIAGM